MKYIPFVLAAIDLLGMFNHYAHGRRDDARFTWFECMLFFIIGTLYM